MADVEYSVLAKLGVEGGEKFRKQIESASGGIGKFKDGIVGVASSVGSLATSAASVAARTVAISTGAVAAIAVGATLAIGKNLSQLEDKSIQLGAVVAASTGTGFEQARIASNKLFAEFKKDAVTSAGETADFVNVASNIAGPLLGAGKSMKELREITQGVIATAPALGIKFEQAGTDVMRMFQGGAGAELPFFKALQSIPELGIQSAEAFNKLDVQKRIEITTKALRNPAFLAAADAMGNTFTGLASTIQDQAKTIGGALVGPSFDLFKKGMQKLTGFVMPKLDENAPFFKSLTRVGEYVSAFASQIGAQWAKVFPNLSGGADSLAARLETGVQRVMWRVVDASQWVVDHWDQIRDKAEIFSQKIEHAAASARQLVTSIGGGDFTKGLERVGESLVGAKLAAGAAPIASSAVTAASGLATAGKAFGLFGSGAGAAGAGGAGAAGAEAAGGAAGAAAGVSAGAVAGVAAVVGLMFVAITDAIEANTWNVVELFSQSVSSLWESLSALWEALGRLHTAVRPLLNVIGALLIGAVGMAIDVLTVFSNILITIIDGITSLINGVSDLVTKSEALQAAFSSIGHTIDDLLAKIGLLRGSGSAKPGALAAAPVRVGKTEITERVRPDWWESAGGAGSKKGGAGPKSGGGQKVEVTLKIDLSNDNEEAVFVKARKSIKKAFEMADAEARLSTSPVFGANRLCRPTQRFEPSRRHVRRSAETLRMPCRVARTTSYRPW